MHHSWLVTQRSGRATQRSVLDLRSAAEQHPSHATASLNGLLRHVGVAPPVRLQEHPVDLLEVNSLDAIAHRFKERCDVAKARFRVSNRLAVVGCGRTDVVGFG